MTFIHLHILSAFENVEVVFYNKGHIYKGKNTIPSSTFKSPVCNTYGVDKKLAYFAWHFLNEVKVYRAEVFTSMGEMLCILVTFVFDIRKSISILDSLSVILGLE